MAAPYVYLALSSSASAVEVSSNEGTLNPKVASDSALSVTVYIHNSGGAISNTVIYMESCSSVVSSTNAFSITYSGNTYILPNTTVSVGTITTGGYKAITLKLNYNTNFVRGTQYSFTLGVRGRYT